MKFHGEFRRFMFKGLPVALLLGLAVTSCKDEFDEYYERPGWLEPAAVDVLSSRSDCQTYLKLTEKTLFSKQLEGSGSYTFFVPTDAAFAAFFADNPYGYKSIDDIPADVISDFISSTMLYNQYPCDSLGNVLKGANTWDRGVAYKHQTPAYETLERDLYKGDSIWVYNYPGGSSIWLHAWHNYRYLPVFSQSYFSGNGLTAADYNYFYPNQTWSQYGNMLGAAIQDAGSGYGGDLYCSNGVIHIINKVEMPLKNIDHMIMDYGNMETSDPLLPEQAKQGAWKELKQLYTHRGSDGNYIFFTYDENASALHYFEKVYPDYKLSSENFRIRGINNANLPFWPNIEEYSGEHEGETTFASGATLFLPTTEVFNNYMNNRILRYVGNSDWARGINQLSEDVLPTLFRSMFANGIIWPSHFAQAQNEVGSNEYVKFAMGDGAFSDVVNSSAFASNGLYHITKVMPKTAAFEGVGSRMMLDPDYSNDWMIFGTFYQNSAYGDMLMSKYSNMSNKNFNLILYSDANMKAWDGIYYDAANSGYYNTDGTAVTSYLTAMSLRGFVERDTADALDFTIDPLDGAYGGWAYTNTFNGDVIRYKKTGKTINGEEEIMVQSFFGIHADPNDIVADGETALDHMPQTLDPTEGFYTSVTKDPTYKSYVNGNVYVAADGAVPLSYSSTNSSFTKNGLTYYQEANGAATVMSNVIKYLRADSASAQPQHSIFFKYLKRSQEGNNSNVAVPAFPSSGLCTMLIPTDEALQYCIDKGLMFNPDRMQWTDDNGTYNYYDTASIYVSSYMIVDDSFVDDGADALYESNVWSVNIVEPIITFPVGTNYKPMTDEWEDFMSGTARVNMNVYKQGGKLVFEGANRTNSGGTVIAEALNGNAIYGASGALFSNSVVRKLGQSNVIAPRCVIHSLDGFILYRITDNPNK